MILSCLILFNRYTKDAFKNIYFTYDQVTYIKKKLDI